MIEKLKENLEQCCKKSELEKFLLDLKDFNLFQMQELYRCNVDSYCEFALLLRSKILEIVLKKGDVGESFYLLSYLVFAPIRSIPQENALNPFVQTAREHFLKLGEYENLMLLELEVLCLILNAETQNAIKRYIQGVSHIQMHTYGITKASDFIRECFPKMGITMEQFLQSTQEILEPSYYTQLPLLRARSILNWQLHCFWNVQNFFNHHLWLELYPLWRELFYYYLNVGSTQTLDHAMYMQFFIYHMCGNSYSSQEQWRTFCLEIDQVASKKYQDFKHDFPPICGSHDSKIVIGILRDRIVENSPYKVEYSFLKQILSSQEFRQKYVFKIYLMSLLEKSENSQEARKSYEDLGIEIFDVGEEFNAEGFYNSHLQKALRLCEEIRQDKVQILISPNNGYGISDFVLSVRSAPKQIFWSHGNFVYDIPNLDSKITHICGNQTEIVREGHLFAGIPTVMDQRFYNPPISNELIVQYRSKYPQDVLILGTIGRLVKINSLSYLQMLVRLMKKFPKTIYLACGSGNIGEIEEKLKGILGEEYAEFMQRFYFCGYVNSAIYGHIIDFWLDSFPMEQGESRIEYVAKGKLSLVLVKNAQGIKKEWITMAVSEEDYEQKAEHLLGLSQSQREEIVQNIMQGLERYNKKREDLGIESFLRVLQS